MSLPVKIIMTVVLVPLGLAFLAAALLGGILVFLTPQEAAFIEWQVKGLATLVAGFCAAVACATVVDWTWTRW